jgi:hypothetical protein
LRSHGDKGSRFEWPVTDNQGAIRLHPHHKAAGSLDTLDGSSEGCFGEGQGLGQIVSVRRAGLAAHKRVRGSHFCETGAA